MNTVQPALVLLYLSYIFAFKRIDDLLLSLPPDSIQLVQHELQLAHCEVALPLFEELLAEGVNLAWNPKVGL